METLEILIVALLVAGSATFSVWRLLSPSYRLKLLDAFGAGRKSESANSWLGRLRAKTLAQLAGGCGGCASGPAAKHPNRTPGAPLR